MENAPETALPTLDPVVARAVAGDRDAEREICRRLLPAVRAFADRRLRAAAAEDFAQDALILLVEALREGRIHDPTRVAGFALGICRNLARQRARSGERRRELLAQYGLTDADLCDDGAPAMIRSGHLEDCYSQLTQAARRIIRATFCEDSADAQIATALEVSEANVRVIRHRTLAVLRTCLERPISWRSA